MTVISFLRLRLFVSAWIVFALHFATNTVREHYPAFSLIQDGTLTVDRYRGFHSDIFVHTTGHAVVGNNVAASVIAAVPLFVFNPALNWLEAYEKERIRRHGVPATEYRTENHPNSRTFFELAKQNGLTLRFGASAAITSIFLMSPLSALMILLMLEILVDRGVASGRAVGLALLFGFGTPVFFRTGVLNHNMMLMATTFVAFHLLWIRPGRTPPARLAARAAAGFLSGLGLALDYSGLVPLAVLGAYLIGARLRTAPAKAAVAESIPFAAAAIPPVLFLMYSQWAMYGNPFFPGQYWMPNQNVYVHVGTRGMTWPDPGLAALMLFSPSYGLYTYGPLLLVGLVPVFMYRKDQLILPRAERWYALALFAGLMLLCSVNQYSRLQFNSGFRYLIPAVPTIFLAAADHLARLPRRWLIALAAPAVANSWVISMVREPVPESWQRVLTEGLQFPWLTVLRLTSPDDSMVASPLVPLAIAALAGLLVALIWQIRRPAPTAAPPQIA